MRLGRVAFLAAAAAGSIAATAPLARAAVNYTWNNPAGGDWSLSANWDFNAGNLPYPKNKDAYAQFTNSALSGDIGVAIDVPDARGYFLLFSGSANYAIASAPSTTIGLDLSAYSATANDLGYGAGITAIQVRGTGLNTISAPITINGQNSATTGVTIDQGNTINVFSITGNINGNVSGPPLPLNVIGAGNTSLGGAISNVSAINKSGASALTLASSSSIGGTPSFSLNGGTLSIASRTSGIAFSRSTFTGSATISVAGVGAGNAMALGALSRSAASTLYVTTPATGTISTTTTTLSNSVLVSDASNGVAYAVVDGTSWATLRSGNIGSLTTYAPTQFSNSANNTDVLGITTTGSASTRINTLRFNTDGMKVTLGASLTLSTGGLLITPAMVNGGTITGATMGLRPGGGKELVILNYGKFTIDTPVLDSSSGASSVTISGTGVTTFSSSTGNSFTGGLTILGGQVKAKSAMVYTGNTSIANGTLQLLTSTAMPSASTVVMGSAGGNGTLDLNGNTVTVSGLSIGSGATAASQTIGNSSTTTNAVLTVDTSSQSSTFGGLIRDVVGSGNHSVTLTVAGSNPANSLTLTNATNRYSAGTKITGGVLSVSVLADGGFQSNIGQSSNVAANLVLDGGELQYTGGTVSTDRLFSIGTSGAAIDASGSGPLTFSNGGNLGFNGQTGARSLNLTGSNSGANTITPVITDADTGSATSVIKSGGGQWVLKANNSYTGSTSINNGTLVVNGTHTGAGAYTIAAGAALAGSGTISTADADVTVNGAVSPGNGPGVLTLNTGAGATTLADGGTYVWEINNASGSAGVNWDRLDLAGVNVSQGTGKFTIQVVSLTAVNQPGALGAGAWDPNHPGRWTIATSSTSGFSPDVVAKFTVDQAHFLSPDYGGFFVESSNVGSGLDLVYVPEPTAVAMLLAIGTLGVRRRRRR